MTNNDDTTTVLVSRKGGQSRRYHTNHNCGIVGTNTQEWTRETAEAWGLDECKECAGIPYRQGGRPGSTHDKVTTAIQDDD